MVISSDHWLEFKSVLLCHFLYYIIGYSDTGQKKKNLYQTNIFQIPQADYLGQMELFVPVP